MSIASIIIHSLGWSLAHSLWQGALIFAALRLLFFLTPGMSARIKYHCSVVSLFAMFTWFVITYLQEWQKLQTIIVRVTEGAGTGYKEYFITSLPAAQNTGMGNLLAIMERTFPWLIPLYILGVLLLSARFLVNMLQLRHWKRRNVQSAPAALTQLLERLQDELQIGKSIKLLVSEKINVPVVFGMLKPVILLPISAVAQLTTDQLEAILVHELAHIRRNDYLFNILQTIAETILFFNPFTHMLSAAIRQEREHCCDDMVLHHTAHPLPYTKALAALDTFRLQSNPVALGATGQKNHLLNRIKRIMEMKKQSFRSSHVVMALTLVACLIVSVIWLTPAIAQNKKKANKEKPKEKTLMTISVNDDEIVVDSNGVTRVYKTDEELPPHITQHIVETVVPQSMEAAATAMEAAGQVMEDMDIASIVSDAMASVNWNEVNAGVNEAMAKVDWQQIDRDVKQAMAEVDWDEVNAEVQQAMQEARRELGDTNIKMEVRRELQRAQAASRQAMAEAREHAAEARREATKAAEEVRKARANGASAAQLAKLKKERERAQEMRERAQARREELEAEREERLAESEQRRAERSAIRQANTERTKAMLHEMEKDGLLKISDGYSIMKSDNTLLINGKQQDASVLKKYNHYLKGDNIIIRGKE